MVKFSWVGGSASGAAASLPVPRPVVGPWDFDNDKVFLALVADRPRGRHGGGHAVRAVDHRTHAQGGPRQRGGRPVDRHLPRPGPHHRLRRLGVRRRARRCDAGASSRRRSNYDNNFSPVRRALLARPRRHVRRPHGRRVRSTARQRSRCSNKIFLKGTFLGWILRDPGRIPGFFPISPKWRFILFGLGTIQYAKHPEGVIEMTKARSAERRAKRAAKKRRAAAADAPTPAHPGRGAGLVTTLLSTRGIRKNFAGIVALDDGRHRRRSGRARRADRPERRRQDHVLQLHPRRARASTRGRVEFDGDDIVRPARPRAGPARDRAHVPADRAVPRLDRARSPRHRRPRPAQTNASGSATSACSAGRAPTRSRAPTRCSSCSACATSPTSRSNG